MPKSSPFQFKQFSISQDKCAMKIGTDGVLLGAWASVAKTPLSILDIGAGTGISSLMLAQRSSAPLIDAIEIDADAYEQCVDNFEQSPWSDRLFCYHATLGEFAAEMDEQYDLIVCNPPFYAEHSKSDNPKRNLARFQDAMPFGHLLESAAILLSERGVFSVVVPYEEENTFIDLASEYRLYPNRILHTKGNPESGIKRSLMEFSFEKTDLVTTAITIETERHKYTEDYIALTQAFYLKL